ncbi:MAG: ribonuclease [Caulobacteraceae bacterium]|nr:ribonuclease [Caulobacteraceae bacterium]
MVERPYGLAASPWALLRAALGAIRRALARLWGRDVMLYTGGVSFYAMLAGFPALAILVSLYSLLSTPEVAARQAEALAVLLPTSAHALFAEELQRLAHTPLSVVSTQGGLAVLISLYAAHRGVKALIAGLSFIHDDEGAHSFVQINLMALIVFLAGLGLILFTSTAFLIVRILVTALDPGAIHQTGWIFNEWIWSSLGVSLGLTLIYRYVMDEEPLGWRASVVGGLVGAAVSLAASWACALYVDRVARLGATYGSIAAVVVCLIWISWNINAVFFGGALATEAEQLLLRKPRPDSPRPPAASP